MVKAVVGYTHCVICGCELNDDNWAGSRNVCKFCLHDLEF